MAPPRPADSPVPGQRRRAVGEETPEDAGAEPPYLDLERLLSAAHCAPSVGMSQPWDFVLVRSPDALSAFADHVALERDTFAATLDGVAWRRTVAKRWMTRRVTVGDNSASPAATVRT